MLVIVAAVFHRKRMKIQQAQFTEVIHIGTASFVSAPVSNVFDKVWPLKRGMPSTKFHHLFINFRFENDL